MRTIYESRNSGRTSELEKLRKGAAFTWGELVAIHEIGDFAIVEALEWRRDGVQVMVGVEGDGRRTFHGYINGERTAHSFGSLEAALVDCIAIKYDGLNSQAGHFFLVAIGAMVPSRREVKRWGKQAGEESK